MNHDLAYRIAMAKEPKPSDDRDIDGPLYSRHCGWMYDFGWKPRPLDAARAFELLEELRSDRG